MTVYVNAENAPKLLEIFGAEFCVNETADYSVCFYKNHITNQDLEILFQKIFSSARFLYTKTIHAAIVLTDLDFLKNLMIVRYKNGL
jgi:hypothetical protein